MPTINTSEEAVREKKNFKNKYIHVCIKKCHLLGPIHLYHMH